MKLFVVLALSLVTTVLAASRKSQAHGLTCAYFNSPKVESLEFDDIIVEVSPTGNTVDCLPKPDDTGDEVHIFCMAMFENVTIGNSTIEFAMTGQGCFSQNPTSSDQCNQEKCVSEEAPRSDHFCCCAEEMCNKKSNIEFVPKPDLEDRESTLNQKINNTVAIIIAIIVVIIVFAFAVVLGYYFYRSRNLKREMMKAKVNQYNYDMRLYNSNPEPPLVNYDDMKLKICLHNGRFGEVYKAKLNESDVCVKYFHSQQRTLFYNEKDIYSVLDSGNSNIVKCIASDERTHPDGTVQYIVIMEYIPLGSLSGYLKTHTLTWSQLCSLGHSISSGLGYLHSEQYNADGQLKHAIVHRDLNSRNILIRDNMTCAIADMGFSMKIRGSKVVRNGVEEHAEDGSLRDVGTVRYMAPEILDCAVNLRDCESSLKQIDVYALALVLWELISRCQDILIEKSCEVEVRRFLLPFEKELGGHPTFESMRVHVAKNHNRPEFPVNLRDNHGTRMLRETIEECWDTDAEARLTAMCVEARFVELAAMMDHQGQPELILNERGEKKRYSSNDDIIPRSVDELIPLLAVKTPRDEMSTATQMTTPGSQPGTPSDLNRINAQQNGHIMGDVESGVQENTRMSIDEAKVRQMVENERQRRQWEMAQRSTDSNTSHSEAPVTLPADVSNVENPSVARIKENNLNARRHNSQHNLNESSTSSNGGVGNVITLPGRPGRPKSLNLNIKPDEQT